MKQDIKALLDEKVLKYNSPEFIENDPILIPHQFKLKEDIEIAGFLSATIAWGNRKSIINNAQKLMHLIEDAPFDFISNCNEKDLKRFDKFVHRTFNGTDCTFFIRALKNIYKKNGGLENVFALGLNKNDNNIKNAIINFREVFLQTKHLSRSEKHLSNPLKNSSAKRLCMYLRWMVRNDGRGVDFGIWKSIKPSQLCLPLDVHTGNVSRTLKLLKRNQNDWISVEEITSVLKKFDAKDPIKYDFALFGLGANKEI